MKRLNKKIQASNNWKVICDFTGYITYVTDEFETKEEVEADAVDYMDIIDLGDLEENGYIDSFDVKVSPDIDGFYVEICVIGIYDMYFDKAKFSYDDLDQEFIASAFGNVNLGKLDEDEISFEYTIE